MGWLGTLNEEVRTTVNRIDDFARSATSGICLRLSKASKRSNNDYRCVHLVANGQNFQRQHYVIREEAVRQQVWQSRRCGLEQRNNGCRKT